jgi:cell division protein FtsB
VARGSGVPSLSGGAGATGPSPAEGEEHPPVLNLRSVPIAGLTRRHVAVLFALVLAGWVGLVFARHLGQASSVQAQVAAAAAENAALTDQVAALREELALVNRPEYVSLVARGYELGSPQERPFRLAPGAPSLPPDAPGSAARRVGAPSPRPSPLEVWFNLLFGSQR